MAAKWLRFKLKGGQKSLCCSPVDLFVSAFVRIYPFIGIAQYSLLGYYHSRLAIMPSQ